MKKEEFLKILEDNVKDYNKKVKFIFTSSYTNIELKCVLTSIALYTKDTLFISNYIPPKLDQKEKQTCLRMIDKLQEYNTNNIAFLIYPSSERVQRITFMDYKITVNETDDFIEILLNE